MKPEDMIAKAVVKAADSLSKRAMRVRVTTLPATYVGTDGEGKGWVLLPGADSPTPVRRSSVEAEQGDTVSVTVGYGRAVIDSNISNPSAGVVGVNAVRKTANVAKETATQAIDYAANASAAATEARKRADAAQASADSAQASANDASASAASASQAAQDAVRDAGIANEAAQSAVKDAGAAKESAESAKADAETAQNKLSDVERVVGTVNWIAEHGRYVSAAGTTFDPERVYYTRSDEVYALTQDTAIDLQKTYYERTGSGTEQDPYVYTPVASPVVEDIATYYELTDATYTVVAEPRADDIASYYYLVVDDSVQQYIASHLWMDDCGLNLSVDGARGWRVHQGTVDGTKAIGTYILDPSDDIVMTMNASGVRVGKGDGNYALIDEDSFDIYHSNTQMAHFGYGDGNAVSGTSTAPYYTLGKRETQTTVYSSSSTYNEGDHAIYDGIEYVCIARIITPENWNSLHWERVIGNYSVAEGYRTTASGYSSHAEGYVTTAGSYSHAEGYGSFARGYSHAEGYYSRAIGSYSHAEGGYYTYANGDYSHAESGYYTYANGDYSHAEGPRNGARGYASHAEGYATAAYGDESHTQNIGTSASKKAQTALGAYNVEDTSNTTTHPSQDTDYGTYAAIIGNGTGSSARSNALAVRWNGLVDQAGRTAYPLFIYNGKPTEANAPVTPCFIYDTSDGGLYHYSG